MRQLPERDGVRRGRAEHVRSGAEHVHAAHVRAGGLMRPGRRRMREPPRLPVHGARDRGRREFLVQSRLRHDRVLSQQGGLARQLKVEAAQW